MPPAGPLPHQRPATGNAGLSHAFCGDEVGKLGFRHRVDARNALAPQQGEGQQRLKASRQDMENSRQADAVAAVQPAGGEAAADRPADQEDRRRALDPKTSCIVQAPAGAGKTTLLVQRFATLLAQVERPEQILAITFTRKAAAEMRQRVLKLLRDDGNLKGKDAELSQAIRAQDRKRGWGLALNPSRLRMQTIDSFARSLAGALPLGAEPEGRATPVEDAAPLYDSAVDRLFERLWDDDGSPAASLAPDIGRFLMLVDNDAAKARRLIVEMLARRDQWLEPVQGLLNAHLEDPDSVASALNANVHKLTDAVIDGLRQALGPELEEALQWMAQFAADHEGPQGAFWPTAKALCMTGRGEFRKTLTKREGFPAHCKEEKERALAIIAALRDLGLEDRFAALAHLPEDSLEGQQVKDLVAICATLTLAVLDLDQEMRAAGYADFTQLNIAARQALQQDDAPTELALALDYRIRHILIDEFQDTSISQFDLLSLLIEGWTGQEDTSIFAVGDPMQSIYRFRDADVGLFQRAKDAGINAMRLQPLQLKVNFRSAPELVAWFNQTFRRIMDAPDDAESGAVEYRDSIAHSPAESPVAGAAGDQSAIHQDETETDATETAPTETAPGARVRLFTKGSPEAETNLEAEALAQEIQAFSQADPQSSIALLVRSRSHLPDILAILRRHGIPWQATDIDPLAERPAVMDLLSLVSALTDPTNRLAWLSLLRSPWVGLDLPDLEKAAELPEFKVEALQGLAEQLERDGAGRLARLTTSLARWLPRLYEEAPRTAPEAVWMECGAPAAYAEPAAWEQAERFFDLMDQLGTDGLDAEQLHLRSEQLFASDSAPAQLQILTIHKAKGLEFDHVLLPCLDRGVQPLSKPILHWRRRDEGLLMAARDSGNLYEWLHEEDRSRERHELQRLFYVACTRAKRSLLLTASVDPEVKAPRSSSMLALLWPRLQEDAPPILETEAESKAKPTPSEPPRLLRLPEDFSWRPAPPPPLVLPKVPERRSDAAEGRPARTRDVVLGNLIHESLCAWGRGPLPEDAAAWVKPRRSQWHRRLQAAGLNEDEANDHLQEAARQLKAVLADPDGRWLLGPRQDAASEFGVTAHIDGALANAYFDRTFEHEGTRWIIDFKTSQVEDDDTLNALVSRHHAQLAHYRTLAESLYNQPIKTALYLTAIPKLVEVSA